MQTLEPLRLRDYVAVALFTGLLYAIVLAVGGPLTMHEGVLSQTTRAMLANHDWIVPRYGEAPWLERPPLPQWIACAICAIIGHCDAEWNVRIGPALAGVLTVLLTTWLAGRLYGRGMGVRSGLILATMYNFVRYSTLAEADIFLAPIVAAAISVFAYIEIQSRAGEAPAEPQPAGPGSAGASPSRLMPIFQINPIGWRPWPVLLFFVLLGLTNLVKGLIFGTVIVLATVGAYLLTTLSWRRIARYCWLWGALMFLAIALPWPILAYQRYPDGIEVWQFDLLGRLNQHYLAQPPWYYFECLLWVPQPWTIAALLGLGLRLRRAWRDGSQADRLVCSWALMPLLVFSLSQGKHHHYMLHYLGGWAILAAHGTAWVWGKITSGRAALPPHPRPLSPGGERGEMLPHPRPLSPGGERGEMLPHPQPLSPAGERRDSLPRFALAGGFAVLFLIYVAGFAYKGAYLHRSREDTAFLFEVRRAVPVDQPLLIESATEALEGLRMQFYIGDSIYFLHNLSYVRDERIPGQDVYVVTRFNRMGLLQKYGDVEPILKCKHSRRERDEAERWTLFHLHLRDDLPRKRAAERITPMQAMYRAPGPDLDQP